MQRRGVLPVREQSGEGLLGRGDGVHDVSGRVRRTELQRAVRCDYLREWGRVQPSRRMHVLQQRDDGVLDRSGVLGVHYWVQCEQRVHEMCAGVLRRVVSNVLRPFDDVQCPRDVQQLRLLYLLLGPATWLLARIELHDVW